MRGDPTLIQGTWWTEQGATRLLHGPFPKLLTFGQVFVNLVIPRLLHDDSDASTLPVSFCLQYSRLSKMCNTCSARTFTAAQRLIPSIGEYPGTPHRSTSEFVIWRRLPFSHFCTAPASASLRTPQIVIPLLGVKSRKKAFITYRTAVVFKRINLADLSAGPARNKTFQA